MVPAMGVRGRRLVLPVTLVALVAAYLGYRHAAFGARLVAADYGVVASPPGTVRYADDHLVMAYPDGVFTEFTVRVRVRNTGTLPLRVTYVPWLVTRTLPEPTETVAVGAHRTAWLTLRHSAAGCTVRRIGSGGWREYHALSLDVARAGLGTRRESLDLPFGIRLPGLEDLDCGQRP
jgi:hypothetical protein